MTDRYSMYCQRCDIWTTGHGRPFSDNVVCSGCGTRLHITAINTVLPAPQSPNPTAAQQWLKDYRVVTLNDDSYFEAGSKEDLLTRAEPIIRTLLAELADITEHLDKAVEQRHTALLALEQVTAQLRAMTDS